MEILLHDAIRQVLKEAGCPLTCSVIAERIEAKNLYKRGNGQFCKAGQIAARINEYPRYFKKDSTQRPMLISLVHQESV